MRICFGCREPIEDAAIISDGNVFHPDHFCCDRCKQPVGTGFHKFKVWRLCSDCLPRPVCSSSQCSQLDRRIGQHSGTFYRLPVNNQLEAFHSCHTLRCSVCGRGIFCCGSPADSLAYHMTEGRPICTRCYYHVDHFNRWLRPPRSDSHKSVRQKAPLPDEFVTSRPLSAKGRRLIKRPPKLGSSKKPSTASKSSKSSKKSKKKPKMSSKKPKKSSKKPKSPAESPAPKKEDGAKAPKKKPAKTASTGKATPSPSPSPSAKTGDTGKAAPSPSPSPSAKTGDTGKAAPSPSPSPSSKTGDTGKSVPPPPAKTPKPPKSPSQSPKPPKSKSPKPPKSKSPKSKPPASKARKNAKGKAGKGSKKGGKKTNE